MDKYFNKIAFFTVVILISACSEELIVNEVIDDVESGGILRNLGETNDLDILDVNSTFSILLEAQDEKDGALLSQVIVNVGFNDMDDVGTDTVELSQYSTIPASSFDISNSTTTNNLPAASFSITLSQLLDHISSTISDVSVDDEFVIDFEMELTDGRVFNLSNATGDVTRTGFFSYFNSQFRYFAAVGDPQRLVLDDISISSDIGILNSGAQDTVFLEFDRSDAFLVMPTITRESVIGATDDEIGTITLWDEEEDGNIYFFLYTGGASAADTVSFTISGGESVDGVTMDDVTFSSAYIIDNTAPIPTLGVSSVSTDASRRILNVSVDLLYESLGESQVDFTISSNNPNFDTQVISKSVFMGDNFITLDFVPQIDGVAVDEGALDFDITVDGLEDLIGNSETNTFNVTLGN